MFLFSDIVYMLVRYAVQAVLYIEYLYSYVEEVQHNIDKLKHPSIIIAVGRMRQRLPSFPVLFYGVSSYISL